jgi:uncharacterized membrane protein
MPITTSYTPKKQLWAGEQGDDRVAVTVASGQNLAQYTLVMTDGAGKVVAHDGNLLRKPKGVLVSAVDATAGDTAGMVYADGWFAMDVIVFPATVLVPTYVAGVVTATVSTTITSLLKQKLLESTDMYAVPYVAGDY